MALKDAMKSAGLGNTYQRMTLPALKKALDKARSAGETMIRRGGSYAGVDLLASILADAERPLAREADDDDQPLAVATPAGLEERSPSPEAPETAESVVEEQTRGQQPSSITAPHEDELQSLPTSVSSSVEPTQCAEAEMHDPAMLEQHTPSAVSTPTSILGDETASTPGVQATSPQTPSLDDLSKGDIGVILQRKKDYKEAEREGKALQGGGVKRKASTEEPDSLEREATGESGREGDTKRRKVQDQEKEKERAKKYAAKKALESMTWQQRRAWDRKAGKKPDKEREPRNLIHEAVRHNYGNSAYKGSLEKLSTEKLSAEQLRALDDARHLGPNYLGRTSSLTGGYKFEIAKSGTNGFTTQSLMMPAADTHSDQGLHANVGDFTQGELVYMIAHHLMWTDLPQDEWLSYSVDMNFKITHALCRDHQGQRETTVQFIDRRRSIDVHDQPAAFYPALDIYDALEVPHAGVWNKPAMIKLHPRKFTQEFLSHHTIRNEDDRFKPVLITKLIEDGLYEVFPPFEVPDDHLRSGLYSSQVVFRIAGFPPGDVKVKRDPRLYSYRHCATSTAFTHELLEKVQKLTRNFMNAVGKDEAETIESHLHIFLQFLTFQKRPRNDPILKNWLLKHYTAADVVDLYDDGHGGVQPGFTNVANNLPGVMQYLDLVRDACAAFSLPTLPSNSLATRNDLTDKQYADDDAKHNKKDVASKWYDKDEQRDRRDRNAGHRRRKKAEDRERKEAGLGGKKDRGKHAPESTGEAGATSDSDEDDDGNLTALPDGNPDD
ncbi:hypothetical protein LTR85_000045 [Meristemomyces frigidus]|nr:hypothetical protein LTR85_000045 [Meristemomyces frigidus]